MLSHQDPGVVSVQRIYQALKQKLGSSTIVMGASFRTVDEIRELAGYVGINNTTTTFAWNDKHTQD